MLTPTLAIKSYIWKNHLFTLSIFSLTYLWYAHTLVSNSSWWLQAFRRHRSDELIDPIVINNKNTLRLRRVFIFCFKYLWDAHTRLMMNSEEKIDLIMINKNNILRDEEFYLFLSNIYGMLTSDSWWLQGFGRHR